MNRKLNTLILGSVCLLAMAVAASAQPATSVHPVRPLTSSAPRPPMPGAAIWAEAERGSTERSIAVDPGVNLVLPCVVEGSVRINGWNRDEVRVYIEEGSKFEFKVMELGPRSNKPALIKVAGLSERGKGPRGAECIWGDGIEIDVPVKATIRLSGNEAPTTIDSVRKVELRTIGGDITLRNIDEGITASAGQGDVTVERSGGPMKVDTTTGNIIVFDAGPFEIGDTFKAWSQSGTITLQKVLYRQVEVNSTSGSIAYNGDIQNGGSYSFTTMRGSLRLALPSAASGQLIATYGFGTFNTELPFKLSEENIAEGPIRRIVGTLGKGGDALLKLASTNGSINIRKQ